MTKPQSTNPNRVDTLLFEQFATLATAPDGIARLRELILQLAVQGKLGTQDAGDEPASVSVDTFFRKNKSIKKKHVIADDEKAGLPDGWISITLGNIGQWALGTGFPKSIQGDPDKPILFCKVSDMNLSGNEKWIKTTIHTIDEGVKIQYNIKTHSEGTVIFPKIGGAIATNKRRIITRETAIDNNCLGITPNDFCSTEWLFLILTSMDFTQFQSGTSVPALNQGTLAEIVTTLPPLAEQHRIVAKVNRLMALCAELETRQQQERAGCLRLGTASLVGLQNATHPEEFEQQWAQVCDAFDLILDCPENVAVLRQTILQLAVQGRLVRQEPEDEPASVLLEKIRKEKDRLVKEGKIKREKPLDPIEEIPFVLPETWVWEKLGNCVAKITDGEHFRPSTQEKGVMFLSAKDIRENYVDFRDPLYVDEDTAKRCRLRCDPETNDILVVSRGAGIGRCCIIDTNEKFCLLGSVILIKSSNQVDPKYLLFTLKSAIINKKITSLSGNTAQQALYIRDIKEAFIPLPPLAEQHRIVAKVDALMALCDALESRLKERAGVQNRCADAVVKRMEAGCCDET